MVHHITNTVHFYLWKESYVSNTTFKNGKTFLGNSKTKKKQTQIRTKTHSHPE